MKKMYLSEQILHNFLETYRNTHSFQKNNFNLGFLTASFSSSQLG